MQMKADIIPVLGAALVLGAAATGARLWWQGKLDRYRYTGNHHRKPFANYQRRWDIFYLRDGLRHYIDILIPAEVG